MFAAVLFAVEQVQHTDLRFSLLVFSFIILSVFTFNVAGGFSRPSGAYVFFYALLTVFVAVTWKAVLGEPAQTRLQDPIVVLALYNASMVGILLAILATQVLLAGRPSFSTWIGADQIDLANAALGCLILSILLSAFGFLNISGTRQIVSALNQINFFGSFAVILGTLNAIRKSGGRHTLDLTSGVALGFSILYGIIGFSKQGMFGPLVGWLLVVASSRVNLRRIHVISIAVGAVVAYTVLVPFSQIGRDVIPEDSGFSARLAVIGALLSQPLELRSEYAQDLAINDEQSAAAGFVNSYYNSSQGFIDRLSIMPADDTLINFTERGHILGPAPLAYDIINWVPHFIMPDKEKYDIEGGRYSNHGNYYSHEMGTIGVDDTTTGISFSSTAEAFHLGGWQGLPLLALPIWFALFFVSDFLCGDPRRAPWGLFLIAYFAHAANEGSLGAILGWLWLGTFGQVMIMFFCLRFAPILGMLLSGHADRRKAGARTRPIPLPTVVQPRA